MLNDDEVRRLRAKVRKDLSVLSGMAILAFRPSSSLYLGELGREVSNADLGGRSAEINRPSINALRTTGILSLFGFVAAVLGGNTDRHAVEFMGFVIVLAAVLYGITSMRRTRRR
jgi:hypothetical protein